MNILLVEDEVDLLETMEQFLREEGMNPVCCQTLQDAERFLREAPVDVLVLDLTLGGDDALVWLKQIALQAHVQVVIVSARSGSRNRAAGFVSGADVYLEKPIDLYELLAVIQRIASRRHAVSDQAWRFCSQSRRLIAPNGIAVRLTGMQQLLIKAFIDADEHACSHASLIDALGHDPDYYSRQRLDTALRRLRQAVEQQCGMQLPVDNRYGWGYVFSGALQLI